MTYHRPGARARLSRSLVALTASAATVLGPATSHPAGADPAFVTSYAGVGSDTTMSVMDALSGAEPYPGGTTALAPIYYVPIHSSAASGAKVLSSFDAVPQGGSSAAPGCITTKLGGPSLDRADGSGNGIAALSHSLDGTGWQAPVSCTGTPVTISGQIDFARSSRGPNSTTTNALTYLPFARDALSYAYLSKGTATITTLTTAQLTSLYSNTATGTLMVGTDTVRACLPQTGSGTTKFFADAIGVTVATAQSAAVASGCFTGTGLEEHDGNGFYTKANSITVAGEDAVVPFSVANWIGQFNGVQVDRSGTARTNGVQIGDPDSIASGSGGPFTLVSGKLVPNPAYYSATTGQKLGTYGRDVYNVVSTPRLGTFGDAGLKSLLLGATSVICQTGAGSAQETVNKFGFTTPSNCGSNAVTGSLYS